MTAPQDLYDRMHARSLADPAGFWGEAAEDIAWIRRWDRVLDDGGAPFRRWFAGGLPDYPGYYQTGDAGFIDGDGYVHIHIMTRTDDIINVAGHRLSTGAMEEVLASHRDVAECAVIGVADALKGQVPLGFLCLKAGVDRPQAAIVKEVVQLVRDRIGPVADFKRAVVVERLPKTRSGKILRGTMQKIADGQDHKVPAAIDDPAILPEIAEVLRTLGYAMGNAPERDTENNDNGGNDDVEQSMGRSAGRLVSRREGLAGECGGAGGGRRVDRAGPDIR